MRILSLIFFLVLAGCTCSKQTSPAETVTQFIKLSAAAKDTADKPKLMELTGGEIRKAFESLADEDFQKVYGSGHVLIQDFKVLEEVIDGDNARVGYVVTVDNKTGSTPTQEINEREVELTWEGGRWLIDGIRPKGTDKIAFIEGMIF